MKILITGAAGFIGYHLSRFLMEDPSNIVIGIDNINDYYDTNLKKDRLKSLGINSFEENKLTKSNFSDSFYFQKLDLTNRVGLEDLFEDEKFDMVVNLAAQAGVRYSIENPYAYIDSNVVGFINILECSRNNNIKHLVYASSSSVYGMNGKIPFSEDDKVDEPVSLYAVTKKSNELMAYTYSHLYQLPTTGLRFFTVYGPWGRPDMAPMLFANAIVNNKPIKVFNNGDLQRDFTYIDDIVEGVARVMKNIPSKEEEKPYYRLFNIGNSSPVPLMDFIQTMENALNKKAILEMYPMQAGDVKITYADTSHLKKSTGYNPNTSLNTGIDKFVEWFQEYYLNA